MRHVLALTLACLLLGSGTLAAQSDVALPRPAGSVYSPLAPLPSPVPNSAALPWPVPNWDAIPLPTPVSAALSLHLDPPSFGAAPDCSAVPPDRPSILVADAAPGIAHTWIGTEAMLFWTKSPSLSAPLIATGLVSPRAGAGGIGLTDALSLHEPRHDDAGIGTRIFVGGWLDRAQTIGLEGGALFLNQQSTATGAFERGGNGGNPANDPLNGVLNARPHGR